MPPAELPARKRWLALAVLCVTVLVANLDSTVLNIALPTLVRDLNATAGDLQWIVDSYIVVFAGSLLAAGSLADRVGRKRTLLTGLAVFAGGSAWAAFSGDVGTLIAARASIGIGGALMIPSTLAIISNMFRDPAERQRAIGRWGGTSGIGVALGPIIGGFLLARFWWGSVFLLNVPIAMAGLLAACWLVPDSRNPAAKAPDLAGAGLSMAGIGVILWSIIEAPTRGWSSPLVIGAGAGGLAILTLFAVWERITSHPMLNLSFFRQRPFSAAIPAVLALTFGLFGALFVLSQFLQLSLGFTALQAGIRLLPFAAAVIVVAPASAVGVRAIGPKFTIAAGLALIAAGLWLISGAAVSTTFTGLAAGMVLLGTGAGLALPTATGSVLGSVPPTDSGVASAADTMAIQVGGALGVAVVGSLLATRYQDRMTGALSGRPLPATVKNSLGGALAAARADATGPLIHLAKTAFISGMDLGLLTGAVVAVAGCLVALICLPARSGRNGQLIGTGRGFPLRSHPSTPGRRHAGSPPGQHQRADLEAEHHEKHRGASTSHTPGTQPTARLLMVIPPWPANSTAPVAGPMISPARLDTKKQCSTEPQWTGIRAGRRKPDRALRRRRDHRQHQHPARPRPPTVASGRDQHLAQLDAAVVTFTQDLEDERDLSAGYAARRQAGPVPVALANARTATDAPARTLRADAAGLGAGYPPAAVQAVHSLLAGLTDLRDIRAVSFSAFPASQVIRIYTSTVIAPANTVSAAVGGGTGDARLQSTVTTLAALLDVENEMSIQRAVLFAALSSPTKTFGPGDLATLTQAYESQAADQSGLNASTNETEQEYFNNTVTGTQVNAAASQETLAEEIGISAPSTPLTAHDSGLTAPRLVRRHEHDHRRHWRYAAQ